VPSNGIDGLLAVAANGFEHGAAWVVQMVQYLAAGLLRSS